jgi:hypothetical protein
VPGDGGHFCCGKRPRYYSIPWGASCYAANRVRVRPHQSLPEAAGAFHRPSRTHRTDKASPASVRNLVESAGGVRLWAKIACDYSSALLQATDTMDVACDAPACLLRQVVRQFTGPDLFEPRIGSTGVDAQPWEPPKHSPPFSDPRHFLKVPLTPENTYLGVAKKPSSRPKTGVGRHRALPEVGKKFCSGTFQHIGDDVR